LIVDNKRGDYENGSKREDSFQRSARHVVFEWLKRKNGQMATQSKAWTKLAKQGAVGATDVVAENQGKKGKGKKGKGEAKDGEFPSIAKLRAMLQRNIFALYPSQAQRILIRAGPGAAVAAVLKRTAENGALQHAPAAPRSLNGEMQPPDRAALFQTNLPKLLNCIQVRLVF
jgi:hypothetical protein